MFRVDTAILAFLESDAVVGAYGAAFRLFEATLFLSWAVTTAVFPVLARLSITSRPSVGEVFDGSLKLVVALTLPLGVGMTIMSEQIVHVVFGQEFDEAVVPLQLLSPAIVAYSIAFVSGGMLVAQNRQRATAIVYGAMTAFNIAASLILIPARSLDGAALAALLTQIVLAFALLGIARAAAGSIGWMRLRRSPRGLRGARVDDVFLRDSLLAAIAVGGSCTWSAWLRSSESRTRRTRAGSGRSSVSRASRRPRGSRARRRLLRRDRARRATPVHQPVCNEHEHEPGELCPRGGSLGKVLAEDVPAVADHHPPKRALILRGEAEVLVDDAQARHVADPAVARHAVCEVLVLPQPVVGELLVEADP